MEEQTSEGKRGLGAIDQPGVDLAICPETGKACQFGDAASLLKAAAAISAQQEVDGAAAEAARQALKFIRGDACVISKWEQTTNTLATWAQDSRDQTPPCRGIDGPFPIAEYPLGAQVLETGETVQVRAGASQDGAESRLVRCGAKALLVLPLVSQEQVIGLVEVFDRQYDEAYSEQEIALVRLLVHHAGIAIERAQLLKDTQQRAVQMEALRQASLSLTASLDLGAVLDTILEVTLGLAHDALDAHVFMYDGSSLTFGAALWADGRRGAPWANPRPEGLTYTVARSGEMLVIKDVANHPIYPDPPKDWRGSIIGLPLRIGDRVVGVMNVAYLNWHEFSEDELYVVNLLADHAALAIENARLHDLVSRQAVTDALTNLPNRRSFDQRLDQESRRSLRYERPFSLIILDFDGFKRINDTYGHPVGDQVLRALADCLRANVRDTDFLARWGGDEFTVLLPETQLADAQSVAHKLKEAVEAYPFEWNDAEDEPLSLSYGCASFPAQADSVEALLQLADQDLYEFKKSSPR